MIRTTSVILKLGENNIIVTVGWDDPSISLLRTKMVVDVKASLERFRKRMSLIGGNFQLEDMAKFMRDDETLRPDHMNLQDASTAIGILWNRPADAPEEPITLG